MARDETFEQSVETTLHHAGVSNSGEIAQVISEQAEEWFTPGLQKDVWEWAKGTFGDHPDIGIAIRGNKEMAELLSTLHNRPEASADIIEECADVAFFLLQVCEFHRGNLLQAVADKLEINKKRSWEKASDGSFQHVKGT